MRTAVSWAESLTEAIRTDCTQVQENIMTEQFYRDLEGLLSIPSVAVDGDEKYPFGKACADALDYTLALCEGYGFRTKKCGNMLGYAEIGEGEEIIGILAHLDVVPEGNGWEYPAFGLTRVTVDGEERLYGRGVEDDKGPAMICIHAMKQLLETGVKLGRRVRIIFGLTEERGEWIDMNYYRETEELPVMGFTPDAAFPVGFGEKGIMHLALTMPRSVAGVDAVIGGDAANKVPDECSCTVGGKTYIGAGKSAHGSTPKLGKNAILDCMARVNTEAPCGLSKFICACFDEGCDGALVGAACSDDVSGELTLNVGVVREDGDNITTVIDIRYPVTTADSSKIIESIRTAASKYGVTLTVLEDKAPVYFDKNSKLITTLVNVFNEKTGLHTEPFTMGGGTYARAMPNIVSFGPAMPDSAEVAHQKNEYMPQATIDTALEIYKAAIERLANI